METTSLPNLDIVVFVLGTTAVGKSKLALDLATSLNGEIVNADSMQIYKGNSGVMTAKPAADEKERVPHHLYDILEFEQPDFNVNKYIELATECIAGIHKRGKLPIVVGGTNYYIEGLLFDKSRALPQVEVDEKFFEGYDSLMELEKKKYPEKYLNLIEDFRVQVKADNKNAIETTYESEYLHSLLCIVDPKMSDYLHYKYTDTN